MLCCCCCPQPTKTETQNLFPPPSSSSFFPLFFFLLLLSSSFTPHHTPSHCDCLACSVSTMSTRKVQKHLDDVNKVSRLLFFVVSDAIRRQKKSTKCQCACACIVCLCGCLCDRLGGGGGFDWRRVCPLPPLTLLCCFCSWFLLLPL